MYPIARKSTASLVGRFGLRAAVASVFAAGSLSAQQLDLAMPAASTDIQVSITPPGECFVHQPGSFQVHVVNNGNEASRAGLEVSIHYGTLSNSAMRCAFYRGADRRRHRPGNAVRETKITLPALAAKESRTFQLKLTAAPHRRLPCLGALIEGKNKNARLR